MLALTHTQWMLLGLLIAAYVFICARTAMRMKESGRSFWAWWGLTLILTSIPATIVLIRDQMKARREIRAPRPGDADDGADGDGAESS